MPVEFKEDLTAMIPEAACDLTVDLRFAQAAGEGEGEGEEGAAESYSVELRPLSGDPLNSWYFGPVIQDISGMDHNETIPIDYCHQASEVIGVIDDFEVGKDLVLRGRLVPFADGDRANEIQHKAKQGVPYQASIFFPPSKPGELVVEEVEAGATAEVNGQTVNGPVTIFRKWKLHGVAICPYGADSDTSAHVQNKATDKEVCIMSQPGTKTEEPKTDPKPAEGHAQSAPPEPAPAPATPAPTDARAEFKEFVEAFGQDKAGKYFGEGLSLADAYKQHAKDMREENDALKTAKPDGTEPPAATPDGTGKGNPATGDFKQTGGDDKVKLEMSDKQIKAYAQTIGIPWKTVKEGLIKQAKEKQDED